MSAREILLLAARSTLAAGMLTAAAGDLWRRIVPDAAVLAVAFGGALVRLLTGGAAAVGASVAAAFALFVGLSVLWRFGALGGGDAKLIAAAAVGEPIGGMFALLASIALAGGLLSGLCLFGKWLFVDHASAAWRSESGPSRRPRLFAGGAMQVAARAPIPYAPAVLIGWAWSRIW
jgi:prepilin peptidase CpaA